MKLTVRQELVVGWIAMGCTRKAISHLLGVKLKTVNYHLSVVLKKVGYRDPARLAHYAIANKLVNLNETV